MNLFGVIYGPQTFLPRMLDSRRECHVLNVASLACVIGGAGAPDNRLHLGVSRPQFGAMYGYLATKHAVVAISETLTGDERHAYRGLGAEPLSPQAHGHLGKLSPIPTGEFRRAMTKGEIEGVLLIWIVISTQEWIESKNFIGGTTVGRAPAIR